MWNYEVFTNEGKYLRTIQDTSVANACKQFIASLDSQHSIGAKDIGVRLSDIKEVYLRISKYRKNPLIHPNGKN